jgi:hypothetical protein
MDEFFGKWIFHDTSELETGEARPTTPLCFESAGEFDEEALKAGSDSLSESIKSMISGAFLDA